MKRTLILLVLMSVNAFSADWICGRVTPTSDFRFASQDHDLQGYIDTLQEKAFDSLNAIAKANKAYSIPVCIKGYHRGAPPGAERSHPGYWKAFEVILGSVPSTRIVPQL